MLCCSSITNGLLTLFGHASERGSSVFRFLVVLHLFVIPYAFYVIRDDAAHPERWDTWYRNPSNSIPYCLVMEAVILGSCYQIGREHQRREGIRLLSEAIELRKQGRYREADIAYQEGCRLADLRR